MRQDAAALNFALMASKINSRCVHVRSMGKEANRWEEQFYLGFNANEQIEYGLAPNDSKRVIDNLQAEIAAAGQREISRVSGISRRTLSHVMQGKNVRKNIVVKIVRALRGCNR